MLCIGHWDISYYQDIYKYKCTKSLITTQSDKVLLWQFTILIFIILKNWSCALLLVKGCFIPWQLKRVYKQEPASFTREVNFYWNKFRLICEHFLNKIYVHCKIDLDLICFNFEIAKEQFFLKKSMYTVIHILKFTQCLSLFISKCNQFLRTENGNNEHLVVTNIKSYQENYLIA